MKRVKTVTCKLQPIPEHSEALRATLEAFAGACNYALQVALEHNVYGRYKLQRLCYRELRERFGLTANLAIRAIARVSDAVKTAKRKRQRPRKFEAKSIAYDQRVFAFRRHDGTVSLSTVQGRIRVPLKIGNYQRHLLQGQNPTAATLTYDSRRKRFYLHIVIVINREVLDPKPNPCVVGVDLGLNNLATCSNGLRFPGGIARGIRLRYAGLRQALQAKGTPSARRTLRRLSGKERRRIRDLNHVISRRIVDSLEPGDVLALEDLTHIRKRTQVRRRQRYFHHSWPFRQLQQFIEYKALERGILVIYVDPRDTSQTCSRCGHIGHRHGLSFHCPSCGYRNHADYNAAYNLAQVGHAALAGLLSASPEAPRAQAQGLQP